MLRYMITREELVATIVSATNSKHLFNLDAANFIDLLPHATYKSPMMRKAGR